MSLAYALDDPTRSMGIRAWPERNTSRFRARRAPRRKRFVVGSMKPHCACASAHHAPRLIVLTGGPGAGKTAVLEIIRQHFCEHVAVLPEAASIIFGGGFPRHATMAGRCASQMAIFAVQRQLERLVLEEKQAGVVLGDRGTLDGLAYWPLDDDSFFAETGTTRARELARYAAVIHLRTPTESQGYDHRNPVRTESALEAATIDTRIVDAWRDHPRRALVESTGDFFEKAAHAIAVIREELPACCRSDALSLAPAATARVDGFSHVRTAP